MPDTRTQSAKLLDTLLWPVERVGAGALSILGHIGSMVWLFIKTAHWEIGRAHV